jgi:hypothetical protein
MTAASFGSSATEEMGGHFTSGARRAALSEALPLVASYFADAATWSLEITPQVTVRKDSAQDDILDDFTAGARLRASLAAASHLLGIVSMIAAQPTFRYSQVDAESIGTIRGRLDLARYSREQGRFNVPRRYPIRLVERETATPENVLTAYAVVWIRRDLASLPRRILPSASPEARDLQRLEQALKRVLGLPLLSGTIERAHNVWRRGSLDALLDEVSRRIEAGRVARPEPYEELVRWISQTRGGQPVAEPGDHDWSFYDDQFDTKLFEIWCLYRLAQQIAATAGPAIGPPRSLAARSDGPIFAWNLGVGTLKLHFQPSLSSLQPEGAKWRYADGHELRGFPDLAVTVDSVTGRSLALFDPKLRRRAGAPTEELYKLLGYFSNLHRAADAPVGAIFYYSPGHLTDFKLTREGGGEIHAIGLDPESSDLTQFEGAARLALSVTGLSDKSLLALRTPVNGSEEERNEHSAALRQDFAVAAMQQATSTLPPVSLAPTRKQTAATLRSVWDRLSDETQTMIVTAEFFANSAPDNADHSGPLLGLAASVERVLRESVLDPVDAAAPGVIPNGQTLGSCLRTLERALRGWNEPEAKAVSDWLKAHPEVDQNEMRRLLPDAKAMNRDFRIPAAHAEIVAADTWARGREAILHPSDGLLPRLVFALGI